MARRPRPAPAGTAVAYLRVSTAEQADSGAGLSAQRATVEAECARRGWTLVAVFEDAGASGKSLDGRPALAEALAAVEDCTAAALIVAKLDRLSRSVQDAGLLERAGRRGWALVASDLGVDTSTPAGEAMANVMASFGQLERRMIGQRTKDALAAKRAAGVRLGRPSALPEVVVRRIVDDHAAGASWSAIARGLEADGVPTAQGGVRWYPATIRKVAAGQDAAALAG
jgi:DNA invertase Pin-like site-specific DNA recombinase